MKILYLIGICVVLLAAISPSSQAVVPLEDDYGFELARRLNAHGDEFMALARTKDGRQLIVATESGKLIVWGIAERRILKQLDQGSPVHCVVSLNDPDTFIAAGGPHVGQKSHPVVRKWRISTGESEEWQGLTDGSVFSLTVDPKGEFVAAGSASGHLAVWDATNGKLLTRRSFDAPVFGIAVNGQEIYLTKITPSEEDSQNSILRVGFSETSRQPTHLTREVTGKVWADLKLSPDGRFMAAQFATESKRGVALFDLTTGKEIANLDTQACAWSNNRSLVLFSEGGAIHRVSIDARGRVSRLELAEGAKWHAAGAPANMTGQAVSPDGAMAWQVFQLNATLVELNLKKKSYDELYQLRGYLYAMQVHEQLGLVATGGDDQFVRVRKLSDLSLVKEFKVEPGVPQGVALMEDGRHVMFSASLKDTPTRISVGDLDSGQSRTLLELAEPFVRVDAAAGGFLYNRANHLVLAKPSDGATLREYEIEGNLGDYAVSANGEWLVAANEAGKLFRFEIMSGTRNSVGNENVGSLTKLTITNDGGYVYTADFEGRLKKWDTGANTFAELGSIRGQARTLKLSCDENEIAVGGNHRDVAVYETATGERRLYFEIAAADFYVTNVWLGGDRLLFSTDAGVLFDGSVRR